MVSGVCRTRVTFDSVSAEMNNPLNEILPKEMEICMFHLLGPEFSHNMCSAYSPTWAEHKLQTVFRRVSSERKAQLFDACGANSCLALHSLEVRGHDRHRNLQAGCESKMPPTYRRSVWNAHRYWKSAKRSCDASVIPPDSNAHVTRMSFMRGGFQTARLQNHDSAQEEPTTHATSSPEFARTVGRITRIHPMTPKN